MSIALLQGKHQEVFTCMLIKIGRPFLPVLVDLRSTESRRKQNKKNRPFVKITSRSTFHTEEIYKFRLDVRC